MTGGFARGIIKGEMGFFADIVSVVISNVPIERLFGKPPRLKHLEEMRDQLPTAEEQHAAEAATAPVPQATPIPGVSDQQTLIYQLDLMLDDLDHLEAEHLSSKGRIAGLPCDCIAKAARELRRHAKETIPIAARQGKHNSIYSEASLWAEHIMAIGTQEAVVSGEHDEEYLREAGTASTFRKAVERLYNELKGKMAKGQNDQKDQEEARKGEIDQEKGQKGCSECGTPEKLHSRLAKKG